MQTKFARKMYMRKYRKKLKLQGICLCCSSRKATINMLTCKTCRKRQMEYGIKNPDKIKSLNDRRKEKKLAKIKEKEEYLRQIDEKIRLGILKEIQEKKH